MITSLVCDEGSVMPSIAQVSEIAVRNELDDLSKSGIFRCPCAFQKVILAAVLVVKVDWD